MNVYTNFIINLGDVWAWVDAEQGKRESLTEAKANIWSIGVEEI